MDGRLVARKLTSSHMHSCASKLLHRNAIGIRKHREHRCIRLVTTLMIPIRGGIAKWDTESSIAPSDVFRFLTSATRFSSLLPALYQRDPIYFVSRCLHSVLPFESPPTARATAPLLAQSLTVVHPYGILTDLSSDLVLIYVQGLQLSAQDIQIQLSRRRPGQSDLTTPVSAFNQVFLPKYFKHRPHPPSLERREGSCSHPIWP
jgi:hypothetical protein